MASALGGQEFVMTQLFSETGWDSGLLQKSAPFGLAESGGMQRGLDCLWSTLVALGEVVGQGALIDE